MPVEQYFNELNLHEQKYVLRTERQRFFKMHDVEERSKKPSVRCSDSVE